MDFVGKATFSIYVTINRPLLRPPNALLPISSVKSECSTTLSVSFQTSRLPSFIHNPAITSYDLKASLDSTASFNPFNSFNPLTKTGKWHPTQPAYSARSSKAPINWVLEAARRNANKQQETSPPSSSSNPIKSLHS